MKKLTIYCIALLTAFFTLTNSINAQHPFLTRVDTQELGLDGGDIFTIDQDEQGYIWLATNNGLHRYDGQNYISYYNEPGNSASLASNEISPMFISKSGIIWIGTWNKGLERFDPATQTFTHFKHNPADASSISSNHIGSILEDTEGKLWVGTANGLDLFHPENGSFTHFKNIPGDATSLSHNEVTVIYQDSQNTMWVGTGRPWNTNTTPDKGGLNRFIPETGTFKQYKHDSKNSNSLINNKVKAILEDSRGNFWIGTKGDGLHTMNRETGEFTRHNYDPKHPNRISRALIIPDEDKVNFVSFIHEDATGIIWIGTSNSGLSRYDPNTKQTEHYTNEQGNPINLQSNSVFSAFTSKEGVLWISSVFSNGYFYKTDPLIKRIKYSQSGSTNDILEDNEGNLWVCSGNALKIYKSIHAEVRNTELENQLPPELKNNYQTQILQDAEGNIWIGGKELWKIDAKTGKSTNFWHASNNVNSKGKTTISTLFLDSKNKLWVGTWQGELYQWESKTKSFTHFPNDPIEGSPKKSILSIGEDKSGNIWFGGNGLGLKKLNKKTGSFKQYSTHIKTDIETGKNSNLFFFDIMLDDNGVLWIGTTNGLYFYDSTIDNLILFKDAISGKSITKKVFKISQDKQHNIWVIAANGLHKLNANLEFVTSFKKERGIDPQAFSWRGINFSSNYSTKKDILFFTTNSGFYSVVPQEMKRNSNPPQISFLDFHLFDEPVIPAPKSPLKMHINETDKIELAHDQNVFSFHFNLFHYTNSNKNKFLFKLENYDSNWRDSENESMASFFNIPPGNYVFRLKAASSEGAWAEKSIQIIIHPPWYRTLWAYILYALIFIFGVWVVHISQRRRVIRAEHARTQQKELEQAKEIKKAYHKLQATQNQLIQSEKMASLGELTAGIAHEIQNPLNFVNNFSEVSEELLEELEEEINSDSKEEIQEIITDLKQNLNKINHHGERASSIVKGMLDHSRTSSGEKVLTDINVLADEYLRLSYHGLRAKDKSFNANFKTAFDENIPKVPIVAQDFGRVILNLINNAFYAVNKKGKENTKDYEPTVTITTKEVGAVVFISIEDNGEGIPKNILDKIFQPFFTTKPAGEGTGLGLSLAYDIVTKVHGGQLSVDSKKGLYTKFTIELPTKKNK